MGSRILLIEDNLENLELMRYLLNAYGHSPLLAEDGAKGLDFARSDSPDLIICDIQLPKMNGYQVVEALKRDPVLSAIPCVAVTALAMVGDRERILAAGFDGYISKPIVPETFLKQIEAFLPAALKTAPDPSPVVKSSPEPAPVEHRSLKGIRVLVVDNSHTNIELARSILEPFGYEVLTAVNIADAIALAQGARPDLILSDVHMPEANGFDLFSAVKADAGLRAVPFAFISSSVIHVDILKRDCLSMGADAFLSRPLDPETLISKIEELLGNGTPRVPWR
jgi:two-component system cell cycle response regulator